LTFTKDLAERVASTFVQGCLAAFVVAGAGFNQLFTIDNLKVGVAAGVLSAAKGLIAKQVGDPETASLVTAPDAN
jgi:hypothetical protein